MYWQGGVFGGAATGVCDDGYGIFGLVRVWVGDFDGADCDAFDAVAE